MHTCPFCRWETEAHRGCTRLHKQWVMRQHWNVVWHQGHGYFSFHQPATPSEPPQPKPFDRSKPTAIHTSLIVAKCPAQRAAQPHFSVLQVFQQKVLYRDWLPVQLVAELLVVGDSSSDHKHFLEQENMQFLEEKNPQDFPKQQSNKKLISGLLWIRGTQVPGSHCITNF